MPRPFTDDELSTIQHHRFDPTPPPVGHFVVRVASGPNQGLTLPLHAAEPVLVGQGPACTLRLQDRSVSRRHASFSVQDDVVLLRDLGSKNGTHVAGLRVVACHLRGGESISLGVSTLVVERVDTPPHPRPDPIPTSVSFGRTLGASLEMRLLYPLCMRLASSMIPVIIEGETGTGKEALAEAIHEMSPRKDGPFVVFDCTALAASMVEAELFGHERGAFTGAQTQHKGVLEQAHGGTLFIDEIGDLDLSLQPKLLRAIERAEFRRIGGEKTLRADVRFLAATRRNLDKEVEDGRFRDDLFHRLAVGRVELPPLRARRGDVALLARHFWLELGGDARAIPSELMARWESETWPGNVRELRNAVARALALGEHAASTPRPAPEPLEALAQYTGPVARAVEQVFSDTFVLARARAKVVSAFEEQFLAAVLQRHGGNVTHAARAAGVARRHFQRLRARGKTTP